MVHNYNHIGSTNEIYSLYPIIIIIKHRQSMQISNRAKLILIVCLLFVCPALSVIRQQSTEIGQYASLPEIQKIQILDEEIFYLLRNHKQFGYLSKESGQKKVVVKIQDDKNQKILDYSDNILMISQNNKIKHFNITHQNLRIQRPFRGNKNLDNADIISILSTFECEYILTTNYLIKRIFKANYEDYEMAYIFNRTFTNDGKQYQFRKILPNFSQGAAKKNNLSSQSPSSEQIISNKPMTIKEREKFRQSLQKILLYQFSDKGNRQICMKLFEGDKDQRTQCYPISKQAVFINAIYANGLNFVTYSDFTYVIDPFLKIKTKIPYKPVNAHSAGVLFENGVSFLTSKGEISEQFQFSTRQKKMMKIMESDGILSLHYNNQMRKIANIVDKKQVNNKKIMNCWGSENSKGNIMELAIQWDDLSLTFHSIQLGIEPSQGQILWRIQEKSKN